MPDPKLLDCRSKGVPCRVFKELLRGNKKSMEAIANRLNADKDHVRSALRRFHEQGLAEYEETDSGNIYWSRSDGVTAFDAPNFRRSPKQTNRSSSKTGSGNKSTGKEGDTRRQEFQDISTAKDFVEFVESKGGEIKNITIEYKRGD